MPFRRTKKPQTPLPMGRLSLKKKAQAREKTTRKEKRDGWGTKYKEKAGLRNHICFLFLVLGRDYREKDQDGGSWVPVARKKFQKLGKKEKKERGHSQGKGSPMRRHLMFQGKESSGGR